MFECYSYNVKIAVTNWCTFNFQGTFKNSIITSFLNMKKLGFRGETQGGGIGRDVDNLFLVRHVKLEVSAEYSCSDVKLVV